MPGDHRLAGLESVDEVPVLESRRVVQQGTHDQALGQAGRCFDLWWEEMRTESYARSPGVRTQHLQPPPATVRPMTAPNDGRSAP